jgi:hypothetical protein
VSPNGTGARAGKTGPFFFTVSLANVRVQLPNPLPGTQPVVGTTNLNETLPLSAADIDNLRAWLNDYAPAHDQKDHRKE